MEINHVPVSQSARVDPCSSQTTNLDLYSSHTTYFTLFLTEFTHLDLDLAPHRLNTLMLPKQTTHLDLALYTLHTLTLLHTDYTP